MFDDKSCHPIRISPMLTGINITCFAASYAIVLALELLVALAQLPSPGDQLRAPLGIGEALGPLGVA